MKRFEYEVIAYATSPLKAHLNRLAKEGWRVIFTHFDPLGKPQWNVILEREHHEGVGSSNGECDDDQTQEDNDR